MGKGISIDRAKRLRDEPQTGHNRWHPDIVPLIEVAPGEEVTLETRDAMDLQIGPRTTVKDLEKMERTVAHPLTGPVYVKGRSRATCWRSSTSTSSRSATAGRASRRGSGSCRISSTAISWCTGTLRRNSPPRRSFRGCAFRTAPSWALRALPRRGNNYGFGLKEKNNWPIAAGR